ncbi:MAG: hypothetical protein H6988_04580 [Pseudomonadales bacterium]|nr:hypothetical protein [Halieaceae bacterium]MCP5164062.1 hypothetical protein [Pseudomonadales bacterium]MCP5189653.1 hypothetical protein [Pseudomonadales bacterium]MCP5203863.1 hypothetical protein [Pseudomonadales bacterium]
MVIHTLFYLTLSMLYGAALYMASVPVNRKRKDSKEDGSGQQAANKDKMA